MEDTYKRLVALLNEHGAHYRLIDHAPEGRTELVSAMRGNRLSQAAKCIILMVNPVAVQNTVSTILNIFEKVYGVDRNTMARIINYLQALIYLFIHNPELTVLDIPDILDPSKESGMLRLRLVQNLPRSPAYNYTRYFWTKYYDQRGYFGRDEELAGVFNKFREMTSVLLYPIFCQKNTIDFSEM